ncbi:MAG TPA: hypothetical protein V6C89_13540 [Drouetiella sp.]|jgi:hypothetical protein
MSDDSKKTDSQTVPTRLTANQQSLRALLAVVAIFGSASIFFFAVLPHGQDKSELLQKAVPCQATSLSAFKDTEKVITFTLNGVTSNFSREHPESPYLFKQYLLRFGKGGRGTSYRQVLEPSLVEIEDTFGTKMIFTAPEYRFMNQLAFISDGKNFPESTPESVKKAGKPDVWIFGVEKDKPVTFVGTVWSQPNGTLLFKGKDWTRALISNLTVEQMKEYNAADAQEMYRILWTTFIPGALAIFMVIALMLFISNRQTKSPPQK